MPHPSSDGPEPAASLGRTQAWTVAVAATLVMSVSYIDRQTLAAISPTVRDALGINHTQYGWLTSAFSIAYLAFAPVAGVLIDRVGCRIGLVVAVLAWSCVSGLHALASSFAVLFALRIALGMAEAPSFPGGAQAVRRSLPPSKRSVGFGMLFTGSSIGAMIAAPLAIALLTRTSWRFAFLGTPAAGLLWLPLWLRVSGSPPARAALDRKEEPAAVPRESWTRLVRDPAVLRGVVLILAVSPLGAFVLNWLPQYLVAERELTQAVLGKYLWMPPLFLDLGAVGFGTWASRREGSRADDHGSHRDLVGFAAACCLAIALVPFAPGAWSAVALVSISMLGAGGLSALLTSDMMSRISATRVSAAGGICASAQSLAYIVANPVIGLVVDRTHGYSLVLEIVGMMLIPGAGVWLSWPVRSARRT
jgi:ACS family hexuronate transporter-like MFS transporter